MSPERVHFIKQVERNESQRAQRIINGAKNYHGDEAAQIIDELCEYLDEFVRAYESDYNTKTNPL